MNFKSIVIISPIFFTKEIIKYNFLKKRLDLLKSKLILANLHESFQTVIIGVDGEDYNSKLNAFLCKDNWFNQYFKFLDGTKGCALSHILALKYIQKHKINDDILILEDDADISKNFKQLIPYKFPDNYNILLMSNGHQINYDIQQKTEIKDINKITVLPKEGVFTLETYFVNGRNIDKTIENILPLKYQIDKVLPTCAGLNNYILNPKLKASGQDKTLDSYRIILNKHKFKYFMKLLDDKRSSDKLESLIYYKVIVHTTMLESDTENNAAACITFSLSSDKQVFNAYDYIEIDWPSSSSVQEYKEICVKILKHKLSKICSENTNIFKLTITYFNKYYIEKPRSTSCEFLVIRK